MIHRQNKFDRESSSKLDFCNDGDQMKIGDIQRRLVITRDGRSQSLLIVREVIAVSNWQNTHKEAHIQ